MTCISNFLTHIPVRIPMLINNLAHILILIFKKDPFEAILRFKSQDNKSWCTLVNLNECYRFIINTDLYGGLYYFTQIYSRISSGVWLLDLIPDVFNKIYPFLESKMLHTYCGKQLDPLSYLRWSRKAIIQLSF